MENKTNYAACLKNAVNFLFYLHIYMRGSQIYTGIFFSRVAYESEHIGVIEGGDVGEGMHSLAASAILLLWSVALCQSERYHRRLHNALL